MIEDSFHHEGCGCGCHDHKISIVEYAKMAEDNWVPKAKVCAYCGKTYMPKDYRHQSERYKFCSKECQRKFHGKEKRLTEDRTVSCAICGMEFKTNNFNKKTCSEECSNELRKRTHHKCYSNQNHSPKVTVEKSCEFCGAMFTTNVPNKRFCSDRCKKRAYGKAHRVESKSRKCVVCGKEFTTSNCQQKTCSKECSKINRKLILKRCKDIQRFKIKEFEVICSEEFGEKPKRIGNMSFFAKYQEEERTCPECGTKFTTKDPRKKFCCRKCWDRNHSRTNGHRLPVVEKTCPVCGKVFSTSKTKQMFCSKVCKRKNELIKYRNKHVAKVYHRTCPVCGKVFDTTNHFVVYCSKECKAKGGAAPRIPAVPAEPRACVICGNVFTPDITHKNQKTCSKECRKILNKQRDQKRRKYVPVKVEPRECPWCGSTFTPSHCHPKAKFCSHLCRTMFKRHNMTKKEYLVIKDQLHAEAVRKMREAYKNKVFKKVCKECGKEFETHNSRQMFCSKECLQNSRYPLRTAVCKVCGKEFQTRKRSVVTCSKECSYKNRSCGYGGWNIHWLNHKKGEILTGKCEFCGNDFQYEFKGHERRFCSKSCMDRAWNLKNSHLRTDNQLTENQKRLNEERSTGNANGIVIKSTCQNPECGKEFEYTYFGGSEKKYCCHKCQERAKILRRRVSPKRFERKCVECGADFTTNRERQIFCSNECKEKFNREKREARAEELRKIREIREAEKVRERAERIAKIEAHRAEKKAIRDAEKAKRAEEREQKRIHSAMEKRQRQIEEAEAKRKWRIEHAAEVAELDRQRAEHMRIVREKNGENRRRIAREKQRNALKHKLQRARKRGLTVVYKKCKGCGGKFGYVLEEAKLHGGTSSIPEYCCDSCYAHYKWVNGGKKRYEEDRKRGYIGGKYVPVRDRDKISILTTKHYKADGSVEVNRKKVANLKVGIHGLSYQDIVDDSPFDGHHSKTNLEMELEQNFDMTSDIM